MGWRSKGSSSYSIEELSFSCSSRGFLVTIWIGFIEDGLTRTGNSSAIFPAATTEDGQTHVRRSGTNPRMTRRITQNMCIFGDNFEGIEAFQKKIQTLKDLAILYPKCIKITQNVSCDITSKASKLTVHLNFHAKNDQN